MLNIMAGSSHWFQVHDQLPFATLKNFLKNQFYDCFEEIAHTDKKDEIKIRMHNFFEAEKKALRKRVLLDSFRIVGLMPWKPDTILKNCREHSSPRL